VAASVEGQGRKENSPTFRARPQRRKVCVPERKGAVDRIPYGSNGGLVRYNAEPANNSHLYTTRIEFQIAICLHEKITTYYSTAVGRYRKKPLEFRNRED
jgi:hypothetical protein